MQALPVDELKIDRAFVHPIVTRREDAPILTSMIAMAHNLGLEVTAEGVDTVQQAGRLTALGCEYLQGFYFSRPQPEDALAAACAGAERLAATGGLAGRRDGAAQVVVIDDDLVTRTLARAALTDNGFEVYEATTGKDGYALANEVEPDCVVLDLGLPDIDGAELISALRQSLQHRQTPIIVLTGAADRDTKGRAFAAGADDYIVKPLQPGGLAARVRGVLRAATLNRDRVAAGHQRT